MIEFCMNYGGAMTLDLCPSIFLLITTHPMNLKYFIAVIFIAIAAVGIQLFLYTPFGKHWLKRLDNEAA